MTPRTRMPSHEVANLRRSLAMSPTALSGDNAARALATLEDLYRERDQVLALVREMETAPCSRVKELAGKVVGVMGEVRRSGS